ncbi:MAG: hypothetical protein U0587_05000 [Candidatus Binatia bacterium]
MWKLVLASGSKALGAVDRGTDAAPMAERFGVQAGDGLVRLLRFLSPSTTASCVLAGGGF